MSSPSSARADSQASRVMPESKWLRILGTITLGVLALTFVLGGYLWYRFGRDVPIVYDQIEDHFKYGSTGGERESGFPYWIFQAMPRVCARHLPGRDYTALGLLYEQGRDLP